MPRLLPPTRCSFCRASLPLSGKGPHRGHLQGLPCLPNQGHGDEATALGLEASFPASPHRASMSLTTQ